MQLAGSFETVIQATPLQPFDDRVIDFLNDLSKECMKVRNHTDVATFGFWCRKGALLKEKERFDDLALRLGRGVVFHSTPSNVPVNFAFSLAAGLLAGNANIVRLPGKEFDQVDIIVDAINGLLRGRHAPLAPYLYLVKYPPDKELHDRFSAACDVRIVWGGDATIQELRQSPLKPRATELVFADRYSIAVIDADKYLSAPDKHKLAQDFYNDTYLTDQNACTSPRVVFWLGKEKAAARESFWEALYGVVGEGYDLKPIQAVGKLAAFYKTAANQPIRLVKQKDLLVTRIDVEKADENLMGFKYNSGFFFEHEIDALEGILPVCGERLQTLVYYGLDKEELERFISDQKPRGIDRIVPLGSSMDFTLVWDGYDLTRQLSRRVTLR
jgi:hypothetical protein